MRGSSSEMSRKFPPLSPHRSARISPVPPGDPNLGEAGYPRLRRSPPPFDHRRLVPASVQRQTAVGGSALPFFLRSALPTTAWRFPLEEDFFVISGRRGVVTSRGFSRYAPRGGVVMALSLCCRCLSLTRHHHIKTRANRVNTTW